MELTDLTLPEWAFLDSHSHLGDELNGRTIILHIRSASVIEIFDEDFKRPTFYKDVLLYKFTSYLDEKLIAALHYSATLDVEKDKSLLFESILKPCAEFYKEYSKWEDSNILDEEISKLN